MMNQTKRSEIAKFCDSQTRDELVILCTKLIVENEELILENEELKEKRNSLANGIYKVLVVLR